MNPEVEVDGSPTATPRPVEWVELGPCGDCGGPAYYCEGPHGQAVWAIHCRDVVRHNAFSTDPVAAS